MDQARFWHVPAFLALFDFCCFLLPWRTAELVPKVLGTGKSERECRLAEMAATGRGDFAGVRQLQRKNATATKNDMVAKGL